MQDADPWIVQRKWITNNPIFETSNSSLSCNAPSTPARTYIPLTAGQDLTAVYATFDAYTASWFKIGQKGLEEETIETGMWFQKSFSGWDGSPTLWSETVPKGLKAGKYLVRHEIISLHSANKPQFYPECAQVDVGGDGRGGGGIAEYGPESNIDIYDPEISKRTEYVTPGPPVWTGTA
ncbi:hypothetical protein EK21DRAFT_98487 [Setomelanomma holmii]|uniref:AA9 family lytic polysaccharide monooxygenase n=1 Tax=Setomelanomma holmii TaxID=210430 RepID=A0A9P4LRW9_9PLEO|nr:hypothetical protein EK21DRAFT_98487 [Setomelanomma holmii]